MHFFVKIQSESQTPLFHSPFNGSILFLVCLPSTPFSAPTLNLYLYPLFPYLHPFTRTFSHLLLYAPSTPSPPTPFFYNYRPFHSLSTSPFPPHAPLPFLSSLIHPPAFLYPRSPHFNTIPHALISLIKKSLIANLLFFLG